MHMTQLWWKQISCLSGKGRDRLDPWRMEHSSGVRGECRHQWAPVILSCRAVKIWCSWRPHIPCSLDWMDLSSTAAEEESQLKAAKRPAHRTCPSEPDQREQDGERSNGGVRLSTVQRQWICIHCGEQARHKVRILVNLRHYQLVLHQCQQVTRSEYSLHISMREGLQNIQCDDSLISKLEPHYTSRCFSSSPSFSPPLLLLLLLLLFLLLLLPVLELPSLKQCCQLAILKHLSQYNYCHIAQLPLPSHLKVNGYCLPPHSFTPSLTHFFTASITPSPSHSSPLSSLPSPSLLLIPPPHASFVLSLPPLSSSSSSLPHSHTPPLTLSLQDHISHYRDWSSPPPPHKALCPTERRAQEHGVFQ